MNLSFENNMEISYLEFIFCIFIASLLSIILRFIYNFINHESNEMFDFSKSFVLVTISTFFVVFIVKSSLTLSLGLVGALSIKDPLELAILFACIGVGIGLAVQAYILVLIFYITIVIFIIFSSLFDNLNLFKIKKSSKILEIESDNSFEHKLIINYFNNKNIGIKLLASNINKEFKNSLFLIFLNNKNQNNILNDLNSLSSQFSDVKFSFRDN